MSNYISRADAIEEISKGVWNVHELIDRINALPSAELTLQTPQTYGKSINPSNAEVAEDYISRADAIKAVEQEYRVDRGYMVDDYTYGFNQAIQYVSDIILHDLPSADAVSREFYEDAVKANIRILMENRELKEQIESAEAEPKWNCTANFVAEQLDRLRNMTDEERWDFFIKFFSPSADAVQGDECDHCVYKWGTKGGDDK